uniref:LSM2 homolog, U6 small nuclear RNA and mRNA degradation associated n=1 Tax=Urocitellus parryii TaxID=9999 RepID=A0A8D2I7V2_UROPR
PLSCLPVLLGCTLPSPLRATRALRSLGLLQAFAALPLRLRESAPPHARTRALVLARPPARGIRPFPSQYGRQRAAPAPCICGTLHSVDQYLNIKLTDISVTDPEKYPHMLSVKNCFIRGSVVRYVQLPADEVDTQLLQDAARKEALQQKQ